MAGTSRIELASALIRWSLVLWLLDTFVISRASPRDPMTLVIGIGIIFGSGGLGFLIRFALARGETESPAASALGTLTTTAERLAASEEGDVLGFGADLAPALDLDQVRVIVRTKSARPDATIRKVLETGHELRSADSLALPVRTSDATIAVVLAEGPTSALDVKETTQALRAFAAMLSLMLARQHEASRLRDLELARAQFVNNLSQQIRTPLQTILGNVELALAHAEGQREVSALLQSSTRAVQQMHEKIEGLLQLARVTMGHDPNRISAVDIPELFHTCLREARRRTAAESVSFTLDVDAQIGEIPTDGDKLRRIVANLLDNALKFTPKGSIALSAGITGKAENQAFVIAVHDTGVGIPEEDLDTIFEEFRRGSEAFAEGSQGLGLGLAIAQRLVTNLGGTITAESTLGKGSSFRVSIPITDPPLDEP